MVNVGGGVRGGDEAGFKLRRSEVNAFAEHAVKEFCKEAAIAFHGVGEVVHRLAGEIATEHGTDALEFDSDPGIPRGFAHAGLELSAESFELAISISRLQLV